MIAGIYFTAFALGIMVGACVVGIINGRKDRKDRELESLRHRTISELLARIDLDCARLSERFDQFREDTGNELSVFDKEFLRRCHITYAAMADDAKGREGVE